MPEEVLIVLLAAVARVGNDHLALSAVTFFKTLQKRDKRERIGRTGTLQQSQGKQGDRSKPHAQRI